MVECYQWKAVGLSSKGDSCSFSHDPASALKRKAHGQRSKGDYCSFSHDLLACGNKSKGQRRKGRSSSLASHSKAKQTDGEEQKSSQGSGNKQENSKDKSEIPCRLKFCQNPFCRFWHPSLCLKYKSEKGCVHGDRCHFRHIVAEGKRNKKSKKGGARGSVAILKESLPLGCVFQYSNPRKSILREAGK